MHTYIRLFLNLLLPLSLLFVIASIGYFTLDYDFSKAFRLGVLTGVLIGIGTSLVIAFVLLILRNLKKISNTEFEPHTKTQTVPVDKVVEENKRSKQEKGIYEEIKCMVLMENELTFEVLINALKSEYKFAVTQYDPQKKSISIETKEGIIQTTITSLTKHTSQIILLTQNNTNQVKKLLSQIKEKEHSFLQY
jgi:hypothetical protein